jgi:hypothetical protein
VNALHAQQQHTCRAAGSASRLIVAAFLPFAGSISLVATGALVTATALKAWRLRCSGAMALPEPRTHTRAARRAPRALLKPPDIAYQ